MRAKTKTWPRMPNEKDRQNLPKDIILLVEEVPMLIMSEILPPRNIKLAQVIEKLDKIMK